MKKIYEVENTVIDDNVPHFAELDTNDFKDIIDTGVKALNEYDALSIEFNKISFKVDFFNDEEKTELFDLGKSCENSWYFHGLLIYKHYSKLRWYSKHTDEELIIELRNRDLID